MKIVYLDCVETQNVIRFQIFFIFRLRRLLVLECEELLKNTRHFAMKPCQSRLPAPDNCYKADGENNLNRSCQALYSFSSNTCVCLLFPHSSSHSIHFGSLNTSARQRFLSLSAASKRLSPKTEGRLVISHSKPVPNQDELLCVRVINSPHNGFSSWFTAQ